MRAAWLDLEAGWMAWFEADGGRIFAWRNDGTWFEDYPDEWEGAEIPGEAPEGKYIPQRGLGHVWHKNDLRGKIGYALRPAEQGVDGDFEAVEGGFTLRLGEDVYHLVEKPPEPEPEPEPEPTPEDGSALAGLLRAIKDLLVQLVALWVGRGGDWVWLPVLDMPLNLSMIAFVHENGRVQFGKYDMVLALPDEDTALVREKLRKRCGDGDSDDVEVGLAAKRSRKRAKRR